MRQGLLWLGGGERVLNYNLCNTLYMVDQFLKIYTT